MDNYIKSMTLTKYFEYTKIKRMDNTSRLGIMWYNSGLLTLVNTINLVGHYAHEDFFRGTR